MTDSFKWPTPPQFISPPGVSTAADKDCLIVLNDGQKLLAKNSLVKLSALSPTAAAFICFW